MAEIFCDEDEPIHPDPDIAQLYEGDWSASGLTSPSCYGERSDNMEAKVWLGTKACDYGAVWMMRAEYCFDMYETMHPGTDTGRPGGGGGAAEAPSGPTPSPPARVRAGGAERPTTTPRAGSEEGAPMGRQAQRERGSAT